MEKQYLRYERDQLNYAKSAFQVVINAIPDPVTKTLELTLTSEMYEPEIRYTTNGESPDQNSLLYQEPFTISESSTVKAAVFGNGKMKGAVMEQNFLLHKAFGHETTLKHSNSNRFDAHGQYGLVDGVLGSINHEDGLWKGFLGDDMVATIDLGEVKEIQGVAIHTLQHTGSWIFYPTTLVVEASDDGKQFTQLAEVANTVSPLQSGRMIKEMEIQLNQANTRYLRITAVNQSLCPVGHAGEGKKAWMFISEIVVE
jgi:hexosaminidase